MLQRLYWMVVLLVGGTFLIGVGQQSPSHGRWVNGHARVVGANITPDAARKKAIQQARLDALGKLAVGVESQIQYLVTETKKGRFDAFHELIRSRLYGRILQEDTLKWKHYFLKDGTPVYEVWLRVYAVSDIGQPDPDFRLQAQLNRSIFRQGEEMVIRLRTTRSCYLYIFNIFNGDSIQLLFPNPVMTDHFLPANQWWEFPPKNFRKWVELEVRGQPGQSITHEAVLIIATRDPLHIPAQSREPIKNGYIWPLKTLVFQLNRWLFPIPLSRRTEALLPYTVVQDSLND